MPWRCSRRLNPGDHLDTALGLNNLAVDLRAGYTERARELDEKALAVRQRLERRSLAAIAPVRGPPPSLDLAGPLER